jgi:hypothetical protein
VAMAEHDGGGRRSVRQGRAVGILTGEGRGGTWAAVAAPGLLVWAGPT